MFPDGRENFQEYRESMASTESSSQVRAEEESVSKPLGSESRNVVKFEEAEMPSLDHMTFLSDGVYYCQALNCKWEEGEYKKNRLRYLFYPKRTQCSISYLPENTFGSTSNLSNVHKLYVVIVQLNKRICADMS